MDLTFLSKSIESLRASTVGDPIFIEDKGVFEYSVKSIEVAVILKLVRAGQGINAMNLLCEHGFFIDMGAIFRCVDDCAQEIYFILEKYPQKSDQVDKFLAEFFSNTIDGYLNTKEEPVRAKKIHNAYLRFLTGAEQDEETRKWILNVYRTFSGFVHASYAHIMQAFGGPRRNPSFNISGVPSQVERDKQMQIVKAAYMSVLHAVGFAASKFNQKQLHLDVCNHF